MLNINADMEFVEDRKQCSYFDNKLSDTRYKIQHDCNANDAYRLLERGWRRFGKMSFVPECVDCNECMSIRIDVKNYKFSKSDKRVLAKNKDTDVYVQEPSLSLEHIDLYNRYHKHMEAKKQWKSSDISPEDYHASYVDGAKDYGKEILYIRNDKLIAVALSDFFSTGISSIYCYYDHDYKDLSLGRYSILAQISIAKNHNIPYIYLGYWIKDHFSMGYKEAYEPFEYLINRPTQEDAPIWRMYGR